MDYQKLCLELFGTDDVDELKKIARGLQGKNPRNAGRKRKFTATDIAAMGTLRGNGVSMQEIADRYSTSRQIVSKYLNTPPEPGYSLRMTYMYRQHPCTVMDVNFLRKQIQIQNLTTDPIHRAFGVQEKPEWQDFEDFLESRCFPKTRGNVKNLLRSMGLDCYDPLQIIEKTHGRMAEDDMWIKLRYYPQKGILHETNQTG